MAENKHFDQKITFLVNSKIYYQYKTALLALHQKDPNKYPANPSLAFRRLMQSTIAEFEEKGGTFL